MKDSGVIVVGGGLAGLFAAIIAARNGKKVSLVTKGVGAIGIGGGTIDVLGYVTNGVPVRNPWEGMATLGDDHPYSLLGRETLASAMEALLALCSQENYSYVGSLQTNQWIPTAFGTLKPSCFTPLSMDATCFEEAEEVFVVGFDGLKDYCVQIIAEGLTKVTKDRKKYTTISLRTGMDDGRDLSALDVARWLDAEAGQKQFFEQLLRSVRPKSLILLPPVLGTRPDYELLKKTEAATQCKVMETVGLPPAVTGFRLRRMLLNCLKKLNVQIIEQSSVIKANITEGKCIEIITGNPDRQRSYQAKSFILATGGFFGGGLQANASEVLETVFNLPVQAPSDRNRWGSERLFSLSGQPFAKFGVRVDERLRPIDASGNVVLDNVFIAGKTLAGYDYCLEKSGNGVALATAYRAGCEA